MWLFLSLTAALLFAVASFFDKYLLNNITKNFSAAAYISLASLAGLPVIVILFILGRNSLGSYGLATIAAALIAGFLLVSGYYLFFRCLNIADTSVVTIFFQMVVIFNLFFGWIFLHEHVGVLGVFGVLLVLAGVTMLTLGIQNRRIKFKSTVFWPMLLASVFVSLSDVVFKNTAINNNYIGTQFFSYLAIILTGIGLLMFSSSVRNQLKEFLQSKNNPIKLSISNEAINAGGVLLVNYALLLGPIAFVQAAISVQVLFAVIIGLILTRYFPKIIRENVSRGHVIVKVISVMFIIFGTLIISRAS